MAKETGGTYPASEIKTVEESGGVPLKPFVHP